jgi:hypothetical protein
VSISLFLTSAAALASLATGIDVAGVWILIISPKVKL